MPRMVLGQREWWGKRSWNHIPAETLRCSVWPPEGRRFTVRSRGDPPGPDRLSWEGLDRPSGEALKHFQVLEMIDVCLTGFHGEALPWVCTEGFTVGIKPYTVVGGSGKARSRKRSWRIREKESLPLRNKRSPGPGASRACGETGRSRVLLSWVCEGGASGELPWEAAASG